MQTLEAPLRGILQAERDNLGGAAPLALEAETAVPRADIEHALTGQIAGQLHRITNKIDRIAARHEDTGEDLPALMPVNAGEEGVGVEIGRNILAGRHAAAPYMASGHTNPKR